MKLSPFHRIGENSRAKGTEEGRETQESSCSISSWSYSSLAVYWGMGTTLGILSVQGNKITSITIMYYNLNDDKP